jgi:Mce-associated membrane protein
VDDQVDDAPAEAEAVAPKGRSAWRPVAFALLFVATVALATVAATLRSNLEQERGDRDEIERVSGDVAAALLTYDYRDLERSKARVLANATGKFRAEYETAFETSLRTLIAETQASSTGTVTDIFVTRVDDGAASAIVVANAVANGAAGRRATVGSYIRLDLVEVGGRWRVDGVTDLNFAQSGTTTTTTP